MDKLSLITIHLGRARDVPILPGSILVPNRNIPNGRDVKAKQMGYEGFQVIRLIQRGVSHDRVPPNLDLFSIPRDPS